MQMPDACVSSKNLGISSWLRSISLRRSKALLFYHADDNERNIFHLLNWYLFAFHTTISSDTVRQSISHQTSTTEHPRPFPIFFIIPEASPGSHQWITQLYEAYPFQHVFEFAVNLTIYHSVPSNLDQLVDKYQINQCFKIEDGSGMLNCCRGNDWNVHHQQKRHWLYQWAYSFKQRHRIVTSLDWSGSPRIKVNVLCLQRPLRNRFILDAETEQDICVSLSRRLNSNRYNVKAVMFNDTYPSALQQAKYVAESHIIIAAHGAALANLVFMSDPSVVIEVGFRFGWTQNCKPPYFIGDNMSNEKLLARWKHASLAYGERLYHKADYFALVHGLSFSNEKHDAPDLRYLEMNSVKYGAETSDNCICKEYLYVNTSFLIGEVERAFSDKRYGFEKQLVLHHKLYQQDGMLMPGQGKKRLFPFIHDANPTECVIVVALSCMITVFLFLKCVVKRNHQWYHKLI